jgi:hypothetical protein
MIDGIRRRFAKSPDQEAWNADQGLAPELEKNTQLPTDTAVLIAATHATGEFSPGDENKRDYYKVLVATAIQNGGWHGGHQIPVPWLRMILAGLELKRIEPEMMWYEVVADSSTLDPASKIPSYDHLFPSDRDLLKGSG